MKRKAEKVACTKGKMDPVAIAAAIAAAKTRGRGVWSEGAVGMVWTHLRLPLILSINKSRKMSRLRAQGPMPLPELNYGGAAERLEFLMSSADARPPAGDGTELSPSPAAFDAGAGPSGREAAPPADAFALSVALWAQQQQQEDAAEQDQRVVYWRAVRAPDGACYFYNVDTRETTWDLPPGAAVEPFTESSEAPFPAAPAAADLASAGGAAAAGSSAPPAEAEEGGASQGGAAAEAPRAAAEGQAFAPGYYYSDYAAAVQGPFTLEQLRAWRGDLPLELPVWLVNAADAAPPAVMHLAQVLGDDALLQALCSGGLTLPRSATATQVEAAMQRDASGLSSVSTLAAPLRATAEPEEYEFSATRNKMTGRLTSNLRPVGEDAKAAAVAALRGRSAGEYYDSHLDKWCDTTQLAEWMAQAQERPKKLPKAAWQELKARKEQRKKEQAQKKWAD